ncbi:LPXTG cell wall anchor domain-containing protein [Enterococcus hirae]
MSLPKTNESSNVLISMIGLVLFVCASVGVPSAYEEFVSIRNRFKNFAVILYI